MADSRNRNLTKDVVMRIGSVKRSDRHYSLATFFFYNVGAGGSILDVPLEFFARTDQIFNARVGSSSSSVKFSLHTRPLAECTTNDIILALTTESFNEQQNGLEIPYDLEFNMGREPFLYISAEELAGEDPECIKVELMLTR